MPQSQPQQHNRGMEGGRLGAQMEWAGRSLAWQGHLFVVVLSPADCREQQQHEEERGRGPGEGGPHGQRHPSVHTAHGGPFPQAATGKGLPRQRAPPALAFRSHVHLGACAFRAQQDRRRRQPPQATGPREAALSARKHSLSDSAVDIRAPARQSKACQQGPVLRGRGKK